MEFTRKQICTELKIHIERLDKITKLLSLEIEEKYYDKAKKIVKFYSEEQFNQIKQFLIKHPRKNPYVNSVNENLKSSKTEFTISDLSKILNRNRNFINRLCDYLELSYEEKLHPITKHKSKFYSLDSFNKIKALLNKHKNDKNFLSKLTNQKNLGCDYPFQNPKIQEMGRKTCELKYGVSNYNKTEQCQNARKESCIKIYGVPNPSMNETIKNKVRFTYENKLKNLPKEIEGEKIYSVSELAKILNMDRGRILDDAKMLNLNLIKFNKISLRFLKESDFKKLKFYFENTIHSTSMSEKELCNFVKSICDSEIIENSKKIISPKELDIYIPSKNLAIEYNGLYWHSNAKNRITENYHLNKTKECDKKGIQLIHIFEDDWIYKTEIVKSIISSKLNIYKQIINFKDCVIKSITKNEAELFLNNNDLLGFIESEIYIGLFYNSELIHVLSANISTNKFKITKNCSKLNIKIKEFDFITYIKNNYNIKFITIIINRSVSNGNKYLNLGFKIIKENPPKLFYIINKKRVQNSDDENHLKIYDCGNIELQYEC